MINETFKMAAVSHFHPLPSTIPPKNRRLYSICTWQSKAIYITYITIWMSTHQFGCYLLLRPIRLDPRIVITCPVYRNNRPVADLKRGGSFKNIPIHTHTLQNGLVMTLQVNLILKFQAQIQIFFLKKGDEVLKNSEEYRKHKPYVDISVQTTHQWKKKIPDI